MFAAQQPNLIHVGAHGSVQSFAIDIKVVLIHNLRRLQGKNLFLQRVTQRAVKMDYVFIVFIKRGAVDLRFFHDIGHFDPSIRFFQQLGIKHVFDLSLCRC